MCSTLYEYQLYQSCSWRATNTDKNLHLRTYNKITALNEKAEVLVSWDVTLYCGQLITYVPKDHTDFKKLVTIYLMTNISLQVNTSEADFMFGAQGLCDLAPTDSVSIYSLKPSPTLSQYFSHPPSILFKFLITILNIKLQK